MSKFACRCGNVISDSSFPNEVDGDVLSCKSAEVFYDVIPPLVQDCVQHLQSNRLDEWRNKHFNSGYPIDSTVGEMIHDILTFKLMDLVLCMLECDQCGRLWIQTRPGVNDYRAYSPDDSDARMKVLGFNKSIIESQ